MNFLNDPIYTGACLVENMYQMTRLRREMAQLRKVGLESLVTLNEEVYEERIREFYFAFYAVGTQSPGQFVDPEKVVSCVFEEEVYDFSSKEFGKILGVPGTGWPCYTKSKKIENIHHVCEDITEEELVIELCKEEHVQKCLRKRKIKARYLKIEHVRLYRILRENVTCRSMDPIESRMPGTENVLAIEALMLHWIINEEKFNMAFIMVQIMKDAYHAEGRLHYPLGMRLTRLFKHLGVANTPQTIVPCKRII